MFFAFSCLNFVFSLGFNISVALWTNGFLGWVFFAFCCFNLNFILWWCGPVDDKLQLSQMSVSAGRRQNSSDTQMHEKEDNALKMKRRTIVLIVLMRSLLRCINISSRSASWQVGPSHFQISIGKVSLDRHRASKETCDLSDVVSNCYEMEMIICQTHRIFVQSRIMCHPSLNSSWLCLDYIRNIKMGGIVWIRNIKTAMTRHVVQSDDRWISTFARSISNMSWNQARHEFHCSREHFHMMPQLHMCLICSRIPHLWMWVFSASEVSVLLVF